MGGQEPVVRVARGRPTDEELAALVGAVLTHADDTPATPPDPGPSRWARSGRPGVTTAGLPTHRGPDAWRTATRNH